MPGDPHANIHPHPAHAPGQPVPRRAPASPGYAELHVTSNFTFLTGASHTEELVLRAAELGHAAMAITDCNSLAGMVRAHVAAKEAGIQLVVGCRVALAEPALSILVYPTDRAAYARLCRLLTLGKRRAPKGECHLTLHDFIEHAEGLLAAVLPPPILDEAFLHVLEGLRSVLDADRLSLAAAWRCAQDDALRLRQLDDLARLARVPLLATNDVHYHHPDRRPLHDVLACVRHGCTIDRAGSLLLPNAERHLKPPEDMHRLLARFPQALARTLHIAERTRGFSLDQLRYEYPDEVVPEGRTPIEHLAELTWSGARERYPAGRPGPVERKIEHELRLIEELNYAPYFLTVHDIVRFARTGMQTPQHPPNPGWAPILCQGRGAAANSAVCYCLGVTAVDPDRVNMLFERFISKERGEPPDIDIDFEHERREEVIQYIYRKYGRHRAALTAEVISYRGRSAIRDVGKALGLSLDAVARLAKEVDSWGGDPPDATRTKELGFHANDERLGLALRLAREVTGFPRHLSQHVGGFVIARSALCELVPIENAAMPDRTVIEWDKDDIDALGMLKIDCLGLGMLTCIRKALDLVNLHGTPRDATTNAPAPWPLTLATIPPEDPCTYDMICKADTVGVFQIESRAQMSMLPRLKPRCYYDLVIEVAIVRPGPIQGKMVHPYLRRRRGEEPTPAMAPEIDRVLGRTRGVPLFQEQAMALAIVAAGFTPGEADALRRSMAAWKRSGKAILQFEHKLIQGMTQRGYSAAFAAQVFQQISGFSGYGFPESHAASFALLVYASCWLKRHHPAAFAAALLNSQPMGFYQPAQIVRDAREHGVDIRPIDVNHSRWDCTLEPSSDAPALRLGLRLIGGLHRADADRIVAASSAPRPPSSVAALARTSGARAQSLLLLAQADAFASMGLTRQQALWALQAYTDAPAPLFDALDDRRDDANDTRSLPTIAPRTQVAQDYQAVGLSLKAHPLSFIRARLDAMKTTPCASLGDEQRFPPGTRVKVAGIVLVRQRPGTASGITFFTLEDESGVANLIVRPATFERFRRDARHSRVLLCDGTVERQGQVVHVQARSLRSLDTLAEGLESRSRDFH